jgi:hypothetical protein
MKTIVIIDGYSFLDIEEWKQFPAYDSPIRVVIVNNDIIDITTDERALVSYLEEATEGKHYIIRK